MRFMLSGLYWFATIIIYSHNLIPNPSFEAITGCPTMNATRHEQIKTRQWFSPTQGTPDLFSSCAMVEVSTPKNFAGIAYPPDGGNYIGMYLGNPNQKQSGGYREYLSCRLIEPLEKDVLYQFRFYAKPATNFTYLIDHLSWAFGADSISVSHDGLIRIPFQMVWVDTLVHQAGWYFIDLQFKALGNERFLIIGDFTDLEISSFEKLASANYVMKEEGSTYYFFDHFLLERVNPEPELFPLDVPFILATLLFEFDSYQLNETSVTELVRLRDYLVKNRNHSLVIYGNTDASGTSNYNDVLSVQRANAVKDTLIKLGITPDRIQAFGNGEREATLEADSLNRNTRFILQDFK